MSFGALSRQVQRQIQPRTQSIPAPIGGINARDALAEMPPTDAISMDNWFPTPSAVVTRNGVSVWASGLPGQVDTVMAYNGFTVRKLFAISNAGLYDVTASGAVGASIVNGLTSNQFQWAMFNAGGGNVLLAVSGSDPPMRYDGGTQGAVVSTTNLVGGTGYVNGTYTNVPLTGGAGTGAQATVVVAANAVTSVTITAGGSGYAQTNTLSASNSNLGGAGSGFSVQVQTIGGWSGTTISGTGLNPNHLITVTVHQQRVWYIEANTMNVWYTSVTAFQGVLTVLPLGQLFKMGGTLMQMATWTIDNVAGINDYAAFITSEGEVAIYQGNDPTQASTFQLVGVFTIGQPVGRRCWIKYASDVLVICRDGLVPLSKALLTDRIQPDTTLTYKIVNAVNADVQAYANNFGWQAMEYPLGNKLILNVPEVTHGTTHQWVMNGVTKAWCRFTNWAANCWEIQGDSLYFGGNQAVYLADTGASDAGMPITVDCKPAFSYFGLVGQLKNFLMARPMFQASAPLTPMVTLSLDFNDVENPSPPLLFGGVAPWDTSAWDVTPWGDLTPSITVKNWQGVSGLGYAASGRISMQLSGIVAQWLATDYLYEPGGPL